MLFCGSMSKFWLAIRHEMLPEVLRNLFDRFGQCKEPVNSKKDQMSDIIQFSMSILSWVFLVPYLWMQPRHHNRETPKRTMTHPQSRHSQNPLLVNAGIFQEVDLTWQHFRLSFSVRGELVWNPSKMNRFDLEFLVKNSETCLFRDSGMSVSYFA
jgi:hypothetical protein